jgi:subtilisin family serine protease
MYPSDFLVISITSIDNIIHSWCYNCEFNNPPGFNFTDGDGYFSISSPGTANGVITVGSYNITDENLGLSGTLGGLSYFSSKGPRTDNIIKPTITAPGNRIVSSLSSFDANYQSGGNLFSDITNIFGNHTYGKMQGTSMAAPVVTGIIALWLEAYPQLTTNEVLNIISNSAINNDSYVTETFNYYGTNYSSIPNVRWGYGKIDALEGIKLIESALSVENLNNQSKLNAYPNPFTNQLTIESKEPIHKIEIYNLLGQKVKNVTFNNLSNKKTIVDLSTIGLGNYFARVFSNNDIYTLKLIKK